MPSSAPAELDAAGITGTELRAAYLACRQLNARHGRTYFLATRMLPPAKRPAVHALYGFARYADELVDDVTDDRPAAEKAERLAELTLQLGAALAGRPAAHPVLAAVSDTVDRYAIDHELFTAFMTSMRMDTSVSEYATFEDLAVYMHGSAAAIGLQMLPVLGTTAPQAEVEAPAAALGVAFQLTNFLRDIGEDLDRGRLYLPTDELAAFGVDRELLQHCRTARTGDQRVRRALAHLVAHTRAVYRRAEPGIALLAPASRPCIRCAYTLYEDILDEIESAGYDVLSRRVAVPLRRRASVALPRFAAALVARRGART